MIREKTLIINNYRAGIDAFVKIRFDEEGLVQEAISTINKILTDLEEIAIENPKEWDKERIEHFKKFGDEFEKRKMIEHGIFNKEDI